MWILHLLGSAIWIGGLGGPLVLAAPGAVSAAERGAFWAPVIRRFSVMAMGCVAAIGLSGLFLYLEHVDGPSQLFTTMYGRVSASTWTWGTLETVAVIAVTVGGYRVSGRVARRRSAAERGAFWAPVIRRFSVMAMGCVAAIGLSGLFLYLEHVDGPSQLFTTMYGRVSASTWTWGTLETVAVIAVAEPSTPLASGL